MNDSEAKIKENGDGLQPDSWQSSRREVQIVGYLEPGVDLSLRSFRNEAEIHAINCALEQTGWNRKQAAKLLSISYRSLLYKIRRHNITPTVEHS
jgi:transcriptional regulator with GAF, ATPase, and Fis domain